MLGKQVFILGGRVPAGGRSLPRREGEKARWAEPVILATRGLFFPRQG